MRYIRTALFTLCLLSAFSTAVRSQSTESTVARPGPISIGQDGKLTYNPAASGDQIPDYSFCGYKNSQSAIPNVPVKVIVPAMKGDATQKIQQAIDYVSALPENANGFRGTVLLEKGVFEIAGKLQIRKSGVVLRGSGSGKDETVLFGTGYDRETLITIKGDNNRTLEGEMALASRYVPVNSTKLSFDKPHPFKVGDQVIVKRPSPAQWLSDIGADKIGVYVDYQLTKWEPNDFDLKWDRKVLAVSGNTITIDVPITNSLDPKYGVGSVSKYKWPGRISGSGIENLRCISNFDSNNQKDENHRWMAVTIENAQDCWVRRVIAEHFVSSAVAVWETAKQVTVEDCKSLAPTGEIGNHRRFSFQTLGQQVLFQRCYAEYGYHPYSVGFSTPGPNAFVQCYAYLPYHFSGATGGWANGILFDKMTVDGGNISFAYRDVDGQGGGWSAANCLSWQAKAAKIFIDNPPNARNWAYGSKAQGYGTGEHLQPGKFLNPESLFYAQLEARTGKKSPELEKILLYTTDRTTAPTPALAKSLSEVARKPDITMNEWIDQMISKYPIMNDLSGSRKFSQLALPKAALKSSRSSTIAVQNGLLVRDNALITGRKSRTSMWRGSTRPSELKNPSAHLSRFVPGRSGRGLTDEIDTVIADMLRNNGAALQHFPALWYERRRDDHSRSRRADADVWTPFYEQPFARSGQGEAFDRLSKYDLNQWNTWYWLRLKQFAGRARENGLLLIQEHYLQHNIIEEGAHWADYPWRTANNVNNIGFAENTAYAGDKRVFMAEEFYDISREPLRTLHRNYIRESLDNFKGNPNVLHHLGIEYTGPLHFVQFWLDVIAEWERDNNQNVLVMLAGTKDVQDAILADPKRKAIVDIIDILHWQYRKDGTLYSPAGGESLAPRQQARLVEPGESSSSQVYRAVSELRSLYPDKAVVYSRGGGDKFSNWAAFLAGGSLVNLPKVGDARFFESAVKMKRIENLNNTDSYGIGKEGEGYIILSTEGNFDLDLSRDNKKYKVSWIDPQSGVISQSNLSLLGGGKRQFKSPSATASIAWLH